MIIGIDASRANRPDRTGTEWYSYFLIERLKETQSPHKFILYSKKPLEGTLGKLPPNFINKVLSWPFRLLWTQIRLAWEMLTHPPDVLFVPAHTIPILNRTKTVMTVHDIGFKVFPRLYSWKDILYHRLSIWYASHFAYKIIVPSEFTKRELIQYYRTALQKIVAIPHGAPNNKPLSDLGESLPRTRSGDGPAKAGPGEITIAPSPYILFLGRLEEKKNILNIVKAFEIANRNFTQLNLVLAGTPGYGFDEAQEYIRKRNLEKRVQVLGYLDENRKSNLYKNAQIFLFPTLYEGFGLPILEAQTYGCPVVTSNFGANREVAGEGALLVDPHEPEQIAAGIRHLLQDRELRKSLIERGFQNLKRFSWQTAAQRTLAVLTS